MNKQQQELYEKLLKKVNEYCLGYAAEDVIAAIDDLVENYENDSYAAQYKEALTPLEAFNNIKNITYDRTDLYGIEVFRKDLDIIETALKETEMLKECYKNELKNSAYYNNLALKYKKALEILKSKDKVIGTDIFVEEKRIANNITFYDISDKECELLKEILK